MNPRVIMRSMFDNATIGRFNFITVENAIQVLRQWVKRFPKHYDLIIGVPRAGLFFGSMIANNLGVRLSTPDMLPSFWDASNLPYTPIHNILVVEDSVLRGSRLLPARDRAKHFFPDATVHVGSVYVHENAIPLDTYGEVFPKHGLFEWDLMHLDASMKVATDLDGVICSDPPGMAEKDLGMWIPTAKPYLIPAYGIHAIITSRNEVYRDMTVKWLKENGVLYRGLYMDPTPIGHKKDYFRHKVDLINRTMPKLFLESNDHLAWRLHWATGIPTLAVDTMRFFG